MKALVLVMVLFSSLTIFAQSEAQLVKKAQQQEQALQDAAAYETLREVLKINPYNYYAQWKSSELASFIGSVQPTQKQKDAYYHAAKQHALNAIDNKPQEADGYYALAIALGRIAKTQGLKDKAQSAKEIKMNADKAVKLNPNHARAWYIIGKWNYEVSKLNMFERAALKVAFGGLPAASIQESIKAHERSKTLDPSFQLNYYHMAKAYYYEGKKAKAIALLKTVLSMPNKSGEDPQVKLSAAKQLKEWE